MLLISGKTPPEHRLLVSRMSKFSRFSPYNHPQPELNLYSCSPCSCQAMSGVCCEVMTVFIAQLYSMVSKVSTSVTWFRQIWVAMYVVTERLRAGITIAMLDKVTRMENTACAVIAWLKRTFKSLCVVTEVVIAFIGKIVYQGLVPGAID